MEEYNKSHQIFTVPSGKKNCHLIFGRILVFELRCRHGNFLHCYRILFAKSPPYIIARDVCITGNHFVVFQCQHIPHTCQCLTKGNCSFNKVNKQFNSAAWNCNPLPPI